jgi:hypothetical protein
MESIGDLFAVRGLVKSGVPQSVAELAVELSGDAADRVVEKSDMGDWDWNVEVAPVMPARERFEAVAKKIFGEARASEVIELGRRCVEAERAVAAAA